MFLHVRIKTKGGERDTHKDNTLKSTELLKHFHLPVNISSRMLLVWIYFLSDFRLNLEKTKGFSAPTPSPKMNKNIYLKQHSIRNLASITTTCYLKLQSHFPTFSLYYSWVFLQQSQLQTFGKTQLLIILQSSHNAFSNSSGSEQYCTLLAKEQTRPEVKTPAFSV